MTASYVKLCNSGELQLRAKLAYELMRECALCPRNCRVDRVAGKAGFCKVAEIASVASANIHTGEEPPISGTRGSGTIFFTGCNMRCKFCQNYPISQMMHGKISPPEILAEHMLGLQKRGAHNINLVNPSHVVPQFLAGLSLAAERGLTIPIVYNSSGYEGLNALELLDGVIDIYMPDIKYSESKSAEYCSGAPDYWEHVRPAIKEMFRQVGVLKTDADGIGIHGMLIRHLVLPENLSGSENVFKFIAEEISAEVPVCLMSQYFPADRACNDKILLRRITREEFAVAEKALEKYGLDGGWTQEME